ncbi:MAG: folate family ECF transporter S component [Bacilli bacterium]|nr:folate family ECF transporter S component [Bacilli bacterium]
MKDVQKLTLAALFVAVGAFLKIYSIQVTDSMRISFFAIPIMLAGFYLGPVYGLLTGFAVDTVYFMISPYASFWSLYTISTVVWGLTGALIKKAHQRFGLFSFIFFIIITSIFETGFNTMANYLYGLDIWLTLVSRIITMLVRVPFLVFLMNLLVNKLKVFGYEAIKT